MKSLPFVVATLVLGLSPVAWALTVEQNVTAEYVSSHAGEFTVKAVKGKNGLIAFTVVCTLAEPRYVVAHLVVRSGNKILAQSDTPAFTKNAENTFFFSVLPDCLATSQFSLGVSAFAVSGAEAVPEPGTIDYLFRLNEFVPLELLREASK